MVGGCGLPLAYFRYGVTAYDAHQFITEDETVTDAALSIATGMDCQVLRALDDREVCARRLE